MSSMPPARFEPESRGGSATIGKAVKVVGQIYSKEDLSVGLVGQPVDGIIGYDPPTATTLMSKVLMYATERRAASSTTAPITRPTR